MGVECLAATRRWRMVGVSAGLLVLLVFAGGACGYRYGYYEAFRGAVAQNGRDFDAAIRWFKQAYARNPDAFMVAHDIACCYARKGDEEQCLSWLQRALASSYGDFAREHARSEPDFESVRADKRFQELLAGERGR